MHSAKSRSCSERAQVEEFELADKARPTSRRRGPIEPSSLRRKSAESRQRSSYMIVNAKSKRSEALRGAMLSKAWIRAEEARNEADGALTI